MNEIKQTLIPSEKRCIVLTAIGDKYKTQFKQREPMFRNYAKHCNAELVLITEPPDPLGKNNLMMQRLLLPARFAAFDLVLLLDLDVLIPDNLPDIFAELAPDKALAAVVDPRGTHEFMQAWAYADPAIESHEQYYARKGFDLSTAIPGCRLFSINGGILLMRTAPLGPVFQALYHTTHQYNEECVMGWETQNRNLFQALPDFYNVQVTYAIHLQRFAKARKEYYRPWVRMIRIVKRTIGRPNPHFGYGKAYAVLVATLLEENKLVHFAGNYPIPELAHK